MAGARGVLALDRLYFGAVPPIDAGDLGAGARLLVPVGAAFGAPQLVRNGTFWDWVRKKPDAYWVPGDRTSSHAGVDLGFFVRRGAIYQLPVGLPVRAILPGRVKWTGRRSDPESRHGVVIQHEATDRIFLYSHYADVKERVRSGDRVAPGQVLGHTIPFSREFPVVLAHFGIGVHVRGWGTDPWDPTFLLRRWKVLMPANGCFADELNRGKHGAWEGPGRIHGLEAVGRLEPPWRNVYR
jgi:hypothetical protein